jgi:hypothetical protein
MAAAPDSAIQGPTAGAVGERAREGQLLDALHQHVADIERNLGELSDNLRAHDLIEAIEPVLMDIKNDVDASRAKSELTAVSVDQIRDDLRELHGHLIAVGRIGLRTEAQVDELVGRLDAPEPQSPPFEFTPVATVPMWARPDALLIAGAVVLSASVLLYLYTWNLKLALGVLVAVNLVSCTAVLVARKL